MSSTADDKSGTYSRRLAAFAGNLRDHVGDESMLREIETALQSLLSRGNLGEHEIRAALQRQYDAGKIRSESYELVQKLIDRIVLGASTPQQQARPNPVRDDARSPAPAAPRVSMFPGLDIQPGAVLRDRFLLQKQVPGGSMGVVFKALDRRLAEASADEQHVAVKVLAPKLAQNGNALRALQQEAAKTRCLSHPNIVRFIDLDRDGDQYFMVMEWLNGKTLAQILDDSSSKKIDVEMAIDIVRQLGKALEYAHQRGVVHADVKPANVMVTPTGEVKLFDFGVARVRQQQDGRQPQFDPSVLNAASPAYSSMQVLTGEAPVPADDVYSLACLAYRLIAGYRVFGPRNAAEAAEAGMEPQRLENISSGQWKALRKALSFSRVTRFASPFEFVDALLGKSVVELPDDDALTGERPEVRRSPWRPFLLFAIFAVVAAAFTRIDPDNLPFDLPFNLQPERQATVSSGIQRATPSTAAVAPNTAESVETVGVDRGRTEQPDVASDVPVDEAAKFDAVDAEFAGSTEAVDEQPSAAAEVGATKAAEITDSSNAEELQPVIAAGTVAAEPLIVDFSTLPPANAVIDLASLGDSPPQSGLVVMEDAGGLIIDVVRAGPLNEALSLQLVEENIDGNRSAWVAGQYSLSEGGRLEFPPGQSRARFVVTMSSDPVREADREVQLAVRDADYQDIDYGKFRLSLQDDDSRAFERSLQPNTIAFAVSQVSVRENEAAVQVDVLRYRPDDSAVTVSIELRDVTATKGVDYEDPGESTVQFAPGQRSARFVIPLLQDSVPEDDEAFMLLLNDNTGRNQSNIYRRIAVMIRDDDG